MGFFLLSELMPLKSFWPNSLFETFIFFFNLPGDFIMHNNYHLSKRQKTKMTSLPWKNKMSKLLSNMLKTKSHDFGSVAIEMADKKKKASHTEK